MLIGLRGRSRDQELIHFALERPPSLIIDCANAVNPHAYAPFVDFERFKSVFVVQAELLYTFRDIFKEAKLFAEQVGTKTIVVTSFHRLFNYQDAEENADIYEGSWKRMKELAKEFDVRVSVHETQETFAKLYCDKVT